MESVQKENKNTDTLNILLQDTVRRREEHLKDIENSTNRVMGMSNITLILMGVYISVLIIIKSDNPDVYVPYLLVLIFAIYSFYTGLQSFKPKYYSKLMPDEIYERIEHTKERAMKELLETYLIIEKDLIIKTNLKPHILRKMSILLIGSIVAFSLTIFMYTFETLKWSGIVFTGIILVCFLMYIYMINKDYKKRMIELTSELDM